MKSLSFWFATLALVFLPRLGHPVAAAQGCTGEMEITGVIGPATVDFLKRVERQVGEEKCSSLLLLVNTPGGSLESTRLLVEQILNSPVPLLCLVAPSGGHAGSAGAILLQACHVNGALKGTNLGAATPVAMGQELPKDLREKIVNDTRSWLESLTRLRGRSEQFGKDIILDAKAVSADEALRLKAIDFVGLSKQDFLSFAQGRTVAMANGNKVQVDIGALRPFPQDTRYRVLEMLTDPELAYMLLLASLALLYFEITHSGVILPGVAGALGLVIALVALHKLDVEWGGLTLIFIGIGLLVAEMFLPTFGVVGAGGLVALVLGSVFLFDPVRSFGYHLPYTLILPVVLVFAGLLVGVSMLFLRTSRVRKKGGFEDLMGMGARVVSVNSERNGMLEMRGEIWQFKASAPVAVDDAVVVNGHQGLILNVDKKEK